MNTQRPLAVVVFIIKEDWAVSNVSVLIIVLYGKCIWFSRSVLTLLLYRVFHDFRA